jgi:hypothetical protein
MVACLRLVVGQLGSAPTGGRSRDYLACVHVDSAHRDAFAGGDHGAPWPLAKLAFAHHISFAQIFDWILSVALGSTVSRIITQPDLDFTRGVFACLLIVLVDWTSAFLYSSVPTMEYVIKPHPRLLVFRGELLYDELCRNRMTAAGVYQAMRTRGLTHIPDVEAVVLEGNGSLSTIPASEKILREFPDALSTVPLYVKLRRDWEEKHGVRRTMRENV